MYVQRETSSGLNLPSAEDLACSQRGAIRSGGPRAPGRRFKSRPVCFIVRRLKPVCWKVFLLFHMIDLPPPPQPFTPIALSYTSYESQTPCRSLFSLHTLCTHQRFTSFIICPTGGLWFLKAVFSLLYSLFSLYLCIFCLSQCFCQWIFCILCLILFGVPLPPASHRASGALLIQS